MKYSNKFFNLNNNYKNIIIIEEQNYLFIAYNIKMIKSINISLDQININKFWPAAISPTKLLRNPESSSLKKKSPHININ